VKDILPHLESDHKKWNGSNQILNEAVEQIAVADRVIINKVDLATEGEISKVEEKVRSINPYVHILRSQFSNVQISDVLDLKAFDIERVLKQDEGFLDMRPFRQHDAEVQVLEYEGTGSITLENLESWLSSLFESHSVTIFRAKGVLNISEKNEKHILQMVHSKWSVSPASVWESKQRTSKIIFIGKGLDEALILRTFPSTMKLQPYLPYSPSQRGIPKAQFVLMIISLLFFKGGEIFQYLREHSSIAIVVFLLMILLTAKVLRK